jgi:hypothetical protein
MGRSCCDVVLANLQLWLWSQSMMVCQSRLVPCRRRGDNCSRRAGNGYSTNIDRYKVFIYVLRPHEIPYVELCQSIAWAPGTCGKVLGSSPGPRQGLLLAFVFASPAAQHVERPASPWPFSGPDPHYHIQLTSRGASLYHLNHFHC